MTADAPAARAPEPLSAQPPSLLARAARGGTLRGLWARVWMRLSGTSPLGRAATWLAGWAAPPYKGRCALAVLYAKGYTAPSAAIHLKRFERGRHVFIGERTQLFGTPDAGPVQLADGVHLIGETCVEVGRGGGLSIGEGTHVQPNCHFCSFVEPIRIGQGVQIASFCRLYSYDHSILPGAPISQQPLVSKGPIVIDDDAWLGTGVVVLSGVRIGKGAVVGAGSVVTKDVPDGAIAVGSPARVVKYRAELV